MVVEVISTIVLAGLSVLSMLAVGAVCQLLWEGFMSGFTIFGLWP